MIEMNEMIMQSIRWQISGTVSSAKQENSINFLRFAQVNQIIIVLYQQKSYLYTLIYREHIK